MAETNPWQKWLIAYLWEQFLVPERGIPIWVGFELGLNMEFLIPQTVLALGVLALRV